MTKTVHQLSKYILISPPNYLEIKK